MFTSSDLLIEICEISGRINFFIVVENCPAIVFHKIVFCGKIEFPTSSHGLLVGRLGLVDFH